MKRKTADYAGFKRKHTKKFKNRYYKEKDFKGNISLLEIIEIENPITTQRNNEQKVIMGNNFKWMEMYPDDYNAALSIAYNDKWEVIEWYFDVTKNIGIENGIPYIDDLYLDVVVLPDGEILLLDEDELEQALKEGDITKADYDMAYEVANNLIERLNGNLDKLKKFSNKYFEKINND